MIVPIIQIISVLYPLSLSYKYSVLVISCQMSKASAAITDPPLIHIYHIRIPPYSLFLFLQGISYYYYICSFYSFYWHRPCQHLLLNLLPPGPHLGLRYLLHLYPNNSCTCYFSVCIDHKWMLWYKASTMKS